MILYITWLLICGHERRWLQTDPDAQELKIGDEVKCYICPAHLLPGSGGRVAADSKLSRRL